MRATCAMLVFSQSFYFADGEGRPNDSRMHVAGDQAEADLSCNHTGAQYACLEAGLVSSWRQGLGGAAVPAVAVQLPAYTKDCSTLERRNGPSWNFCSGGDILRMRLAQQAGMSSDPLASVVATYDLSCPTCPFGSVHNTHKQSVGKRLALQLRKLWFNESALVAEGPTCKAATLDPDDASKLRLHFNGGSTPFAFRATRNCTVCCQSTAVDFDASHDGVHWINASSAALDGDSSIVELGFKPNSTNHSTIIDIRWVRYTAATTYPQCALYNHESLPAMPFLLRVV